MQSDVENIYGNRLRVRACGILVTEEKLLLINHKSLTASSFWAPPGGGIEFGERAREALKREFLEETGLEIDVSDFMFGCEYINSPLHSIELFFRVCATGGSLKTGSDPEMKSDDQLIQETRFLSWAEVSDQPPESVHGVFRFLSDPSQIVRLNGYLILL